jgi:hypothetical protein
MNRVQFQPGLSMHKFMELYGTSEKCEAAVINWRWPKGYVCPSCGQADDSFSSFRRGICCIGSAAVITSSAA